MKRKKMIRLRLGELRSLIRKCLNEEAAGPGISADPTDVKGFYPYEIERGVDVQGFWYRSPGRSVGADGDPGRPVDAAEYIGFKTKGATPEDAAAEAAPKETTEAPA